ncbi:MAG: ABC transporter substrate-binding protein [Thermoprotei archaeon]|nr:ABC transporter substrate-binding protein [TACK group archaeon]
MLKRILAVVVLILVVSAFVIPFETAVAQSSSWRPVTVIDDDGTVVHILQRPTRIVSLAPSNTVIAYGLGLGSELVGGLGNEYVCSTIVPIASNLTSVGSYYGLDYDEILALKPQLILASGINSEQQVEKLRSMNLTVIVLNPTNISGVERDIVLVGNATGTQAKAQEIVAWMNTVISQVQSRLPSNKVSAFYLLDTSGGYWTAGNDTFMNSMIELAGGTNVASGVEGWGTISPESLLADRPQTLLLDQYVNASVIGQAPFNAMPAVKDGRVYVLPHEGWFDQPTYRLIYGIVWLAEVLHPSAMKGYVPPQCPAYTGTEAIPQPKSLVPAQSSIPGYLEAAGVIVVLALLGVLSYWYLRKKVDHLKQNESSK